MANGRPMGKQDPMVRVGDNRAYDPKTQQYYDAQYTKSGGMGILGQIIPYVIGAFNPIAGAAVGAAMGASQGGKGALMNAVMGGAKGYLGGSSLGSLVGNPAASTGISSLFSSTGDAASSLGSGISNMVGSVGGPLQGATSTGATLTGTAGGSGILGALGSVGSGISSATSSLGGVSNILQAASLGNSLFGGSGGGKPPAPQAPDLGIQAPYAPKRPDAMESPSSLNDISGFDPSQTRSALATRGVNQGLGQQEQDYYKNLLQRSLIGDGNKVNVSNPNFLLPIEGQYFSQRGLNTSDPNKFLEGLNSLSY